MVVVSLDLTDLTEPELRQEILKLRATRPRAGSCQPPVNREMRESVL